MAGEIKRIEADRAIYFDVESKIDKDPVLGGTLIEGVFEPTLFYEVLKDVPLQRENTSYSNLNDYLHQLKEKALSENRKVVFFTSAERKLFEFHDVETGDWLFDLRDVLKTDREFRRISMEVKENRRRILSGSLSRSARDNLRPYASGTLSLVAQEFGHHRPVGYGAGLTGKWIDNFVEQAERKPDWQSWSRSGKRDLTKLINHNKHDVECTQFCLNKLISR